MEAWASNESIDLVEDAVAGREVELLQSFAVDRVATCWNEHDGIFYFKNCCVRRNFYKGQLSKFNTT